MERFMALLVRAEFHCHTCYSKDSLTPIDKLLTVCIEKGIDRLAITDHNTIAGALQAYHKAPERIIVGEEILTTQGELLAFFVKEEIPPRLTPQEAINRLRQQGAFISVSHPFDVTRRGAWELQNLEAIVLLVDAIEVFNSRCASNLPNQQAIEFTKKYNLRGTVGSDAHTLWELGRSTLTLPDFNHADSLRASLLAAEQNVRRSPVWVHLASRYAHLRKKQTDLSLKRIHD